MKQPLKDKDLQLYYDEVLATMASEGWKLLMEDVERMRVTTDRVSAVKDERDLAFKQGELALMTWILSAKSVYEAAYEALQDSEGL
jgi:hypothetical protein